MRSNADIVSVSFELLGSVSLDLERMEEDSLWVSLSERYDLSDPVQKQTAAAEYTRQYLARETLLEFVPSTNGPADIHGCRAEARFSDTTNA